MLDGTGQTIVLAGVSGDLGMRLASALTRRGAAVRALVRMDDSEAKKVLVRGSGATPVEVDFNDPAALKTACRGATCVVSAVNGLEPIMIDLQSRLLEAAIDAGVPRFMPSDFSLDFTKTTPGDNRNLDLRRAFGARIATALIVRSPC